MNGINCHECHGAQEHGLDPGRPFMMGSAEHYPEERPVHEVEVDGFWMDEHQVTVAEFRRFVKETGHVTVAEKALDPSDYPDADPDLLVPGSLVFRKTRGPVPLDDYRNWWHWVPGASGATRAGPKAGSRQGSPPVDACRVGGRRGLCRVGGQGAANRGRVGVRRARRARGQGVHLGRRVRAQGQDDGQHLAGRVPVAEPQARQVRGHVAGQVVPAQRLRPVRHGRQRLGVDDRLLHAGPSRAGHPRLLRSVGPRVNPRVESPERASTSASPAASSRVTWSRADRTCARPTTACAIGPRRASPRRSNSMAHIGFRCIVRPNTDGATTAG